MLYVVFVQLLIEILLVLFLDLSFLKRENGESFNCKNCSMKSIRVDKNENCPNCGSK